MQSSATNRKSRAATRSKNGPSKPPFDRNLRKALVEDGEVVYIENQNGKHFRSCRWDDPAVVITMADLALAGFDKLLIEYENGEYAEVQVSQQSPFPRATVTHPMLGKVHVELLPDAKDTPFGPTVPFDVRVAHELQPSNSDVLDDDTVVGVPVMGEDIAAIFATFAENPVKEVPVRAKVFPVLADFSGRIAELKRVTARNHAPTTDHATLLFENESLISVDGVKALLGASGVQSAVWPSFDAGEQLTTVTRVVLPGDRLEEATQLVQESLGDGTYVVALRDGDVDVVFHDRWFSLEQDRLGRLGPAEAFEEFSRFASTRTSGAQADLRVWLRTCNDLFDPHGLVGAGATGTMEL